MRFVNIQYGIVGKQYGHGRILSHVPAKTSHCSILRRTRIYVFSHRFDVQKPKVFSKEIIPYDGAEVEKMLRALQSEPYHWRIMITLALTSGLRRSELLGLEWKYLDFNTGVLDVLQRCFTESILKELKEYYDYRMQETK
jgi:integrase